MLSSDNDRRSIEPQPDQYSKVKIPVNAGNNQPEPAPTGVAEAEPGWEEKYLRLYADLENSKKRLARLYETRAEQEKEALLRDILPLADNLERALAHAIAGARREGAPLRQAPLYQGVELTLKAFHDVMARYGVHPVEAEGAPFDPEVHEAVGVVPNPNLPPGTVAGVEQKGYTLRDKLLRPARVLVTPG